MFRPMKLFCAIVVISALANSAFAQDSAGRKELRRGDLTGTNMEVIISISELKPGDLLPRHIHHGEEAVYIIEGGTIELPDGKQMPFVAGNAAINVRDIAHGGFKVVGDKTLKFVTVHVADKGKPLYDSPK